MGCLQLEAQANDGPLSRFLVDIDPTTGLVMQWEEYELATDRLLTRVAFETFELDGDVSDMTLTDSLFVGETYLHSDPAFQAQLGFAPLVPNFQPGADFALCEEAEVLSVQGQNWAKFYMTDGVQMVVLMHGKRELTGANGMGNKGEVRAFTVGSWSALRGEINGYPVLIAGRSSESALALVLESALP